MRSPYPDFEEFPSGESVAEAIAANQNASVHIIHGWGDSSVAIGTMAEDLSLFLERCADWPSGPASSPKKSIEQ